MVISFDCACGNTDPTKVKKYDGALGYEALVCKVCGRFYDHDSANEPEEWSLNFIKEN